MDDVDVPAHLREIRQDNYYAQQAHSTHPSQRAAEGVERVEPLNEPWQNVQGQHRPAVNQGYPQYGSFSQGSGHNQQYGGHHQAAYPSNQPGNQAYLGYQYQGHQSSQPYGQWQQYHDPSPNSYQSHQSGYDNEQSGDYSNYSAGSNVPHSIEPPMHQQYASKPYHHGQPPGAHINQNNFTATHNDTLINKLQDMHLAPGDRHDNDPGHVTEQMAQANVNGEKTMGPPNPMQYPPLLKPMTPHLQLMYVVRETRGLDPF